MSDETNVSQMRDTIERLSKEKAGLEKSVAEQAKAIRVYEAADAFREAGYKPAAGKLFAAMHPEGEITADAVVAFADEQGLPAASTSTQEVTEEARNETSEAAKQAEGLSQMAGSGSRGGDGGAGSATAKSLTRQEWQVLHQTDPVAARQAVASGRVEISRDNVLGAAEAAPRGSNPYVSNIAGS